MDRARFLASPSDYSKNMISLFPPEIIDELTLYIVGEVLILVGDIFSLRNRLKGIVD